MDKKSFTNVPKAYVFQNKKWLHHFLWIVMTGIFGVMCFVAALLVGWGSSREVLISFIVFAFLFFLLAYHSFFYELPSRSETSHFLERKKFFRPAPSKWLIFLQLGGGIFFALLILWTFWWRASI